MTLPRSVWASLFALVAATIGMGLVVPILRPLSMAFSASPSETLLLVSAYLVVLGGTMPFSGAISSRLGTRTTLIAALLLNVGCGLVSSVAGDIGVVIAARAGWGLGNALFLATVLVSVVEESGPAAGKAIRLFEAAVGVGIAAGPLAGGILGAISWRAAFVGASMMMLVAAVSLAVLLPKGARPPVPTSVLAPFRALLHPPLCILAVAALLYNVGFLTMFSYTPFPLGQGPEVVGLIYCGWGTALVLSSTVLGPLLQRRFGTVPSFAVATTGFAALLAMMAALADRPAALAVGVVLSGLLLGVSNTMMTEAAMTSSSTDHATTSAAYNLMRNAGPAAVPWLAAKLGETYNVHVPFAFGATAAALGVVVVLLGRRTLTRPHEHQATEWHDLSPSGRPSPRSPGLGR